MVKSVSKLQTWGSGMKETRFERSENRVRVRQNLVNHLETLSFLFFACLRCNEDKIWAMHYRSLTTAHFLVFFVCLHCKKTKSGQCTIEVLLQPFLPFFACLHCKEDKIWSMHRRSNTGPFPSFFRVSSLQWRQNLGNAL